MDVIKDLEIKLRKIILNYLSGLSVLTRGLIREKQRSERGENAVLLALSMKEEATSQRIQAASRNWKRQINRFSVRAYRSNTALHTYFRLLTSRIINLCCFKPLSLC